MKNKNMLVKKKMKNKNVSIKNKEIKLDIET